MKLAPSPPPLFQMWILICLAFVAVTVAEYAAVLFLMRQHRRRRQRRALAVKALVMQVGGVATLSRCLPFYFCFPTLYRRISSWRMTQYVGRFESEFQAFGYKVSKQVIRFETNFAVVCLVKSMMLQSRDWFFKTFRVLKSHFLSNQVNASVPRPTSLAGGGGGGAYCKRPSSDPKAKNGGIASKVSPYASYTVQQQQQPQQQQQQQHQEQQQQLHPFGLVAHGGGEMPTLTEPGEESKIFAIFFWQYIFAFFRHFQTRTMPLRPPSAATASLTPRARCTSGDSAPPRT